MIRMTLGAMAALAGGTVRDGDPGAVVSGASHDVARLAPGALYVCATDDPAGARAALAGAVLTDRPTGVPAIVVADVPAAYRRIAAAVAESQPQVTRVALAVPGGRPQATRLLGHVLARLGPTVLPRGGPTPEDVCETLLSGGPGTRFLITELDARRRGEIAAMLPVVRPRAAVAIGTGGAHRDILGTRLPALGELAEGLPADAVAVLDCDDPATASLAARTQARVITFGRHRSARVRAERIVLDGQARARFRLHTPAGSAEVALRLHGDHLVPAALAAAAVALEHTHDVWLIADALGAATPDDGTGLRERPDGVTILDDAADAAPETVLAALRTLLSVAAGRRRTIAVLGQLTGLGASAAAVHARIGRAATRMGVDEVIAVGGADAARYGGTHALNRAAAAGLLSEILRPGDVVLVAGAAEPALTGVADLPA